MNKNTCLLWTLIFLSGAHITCSFALERSEDSPIIFKPVARLATNTPSAAQSADNAHTPGAGTPSTIASRPLSISPHSAFRPCNAKRQSPDEAAPEHDDSVALSLHPTTTDFQASTDASAASSSTYPTTCAMPYAAIPPAAKVRRLHDDVPALVFTDETPQASSSNGTTTSPLSALLTMVARAGREERAAAEPAKSEKSVTFTSRKKYEHIACALKPVKLGFICPAPASEQRADCRQRFFSKKLFREHLETHPSIYTADGIRCPYCGIYLTNIARCINHVYGKKHLNCRMYKCPRCPKTFIQAGSCTHHFMTEHEQKGDFRCSCGRIFTEICEWKSHFHHCATFSDFATKTYAFACSCGTRLRNSEIDAHTEECSWAKSGVFICPCKKMFAYAQRDRWLAHQLTCPVAHTAAVPDKKS